MEEYILDVGTATAYFQALKSYHEGGIPIGAALMIGPAVIAIGHNRRNQYGSNIRHGEIDCIERAGQQFDFSKSTLFTTLSPCSMCAGAILLFGIGRLVILDDENVSDFSTNADKLISSGVEVIVRPHPPSISLNRFFQKEFRDKWLPDVGRRSGISENDLALFQDTPPRSIPKR